MNEIKKAAVRMAASGSSRPEDPNNRHMGSSRIKPVILKLAVYGLVPATLAHWLIVRLQAGGK